MMTVLITGLNNHTRGIVECLHHNECLYNYPSG